jgi:penicillin G amidase
MLILGASCGRKAMPPAPLVAQVAGTLEVAGLSAPVRVVRDRWGVPHIYADSQDDLFFAQGFVQAQDRLFQMDLWRRSAQGRLSEVLGPNFIERDAMTRRIQYRGDMDAEWTSYSPDTKAIATSFVRGINAWVEIARGRPPEEFVLAGWLPELWRPEDILNRTEAFGMTANARAEVLRARILAAVGPSATMSLLPLDPFRPATVPAGLDVSTISYVVDDALRRIGTPPFFTGLAATSQKGDGSRFSALAASGPEKGDGSRFLAGKPNVSSDFSPTMGSDPGQGESTPVPFSRGGSNNWVVAGERSSTGSPLLANDPHRDLDHPSLRYLVHLHAPGWNVIGAVTPWLPGVAIGHNERVGWGLTIFSSDVQDLYVEQVNPDNAHQLRERGRWIDTESMKDSIPVKGRAKPFEFDREFSPHGVIIATDRRQHLAFALKWTGFESGTAGYLGALAIDRVSSAQEFRSALARWKAPGENFVYADANGNIGYQAAALTPRRRTWDGTLPAPGWSRVYEWDGWYSLDDLPHVLNPPSGYAATANNNTLASGERRAIGFEWGSPARINRIREVFAEHPRFSIDDFKQFQHDVRAWNAEQLVPLLQTVRADRADVEEARQRLLTWDRRMAPGSREATIYAVWERALLTSLVDGKLEASLARDYTANAPDSFDILVPAITRPSAAWFGRDAAKARDALLVSALASAVDELRTRLGADPSSWTWGRVHTATFKHPLAVTLAARQRFNIGPFERPGYANTVMATYGAGFEQNGGASFREILDPSNWDRSVATSAPGQSGSPSSPHFSDLARLWAAGEYFPLPFSEAAVAANAESTLTLMPKPR